MRVNTVASALTPLPSPVGTEEGDAACRLSASLFIRNP